MTRRHGVRPRAVVVLLSLVSVTGAAPPHPRPTTADAKALAKAEATVIDAAIADLKKEYAARLKEPDTARLRTQCNYFIDHPVQLSPESLLDALERPFPDDPRSIAYVKWQLLSGAPETFDAQHLTRVLSAYEKAPAPPPRFGSTPDDRNKLDLLLLKARKEDDAALTTRVEERVRTETEANRPILAYRDALYARLPPGYDSLVAGFRDAHERTTAAAGGGASDGHAERVVKDALAWAQSGTADPDQCGRLTELVARLRHVRSPPYYARVALRYDRLSWSVKTDGVYSPKKLSDLENVLREVHKLGKAQQAAAQKNARQSGRKK